MTFNLISYITMYMTLDYVLVNKANSRQQIKIITNILIRILIITTNIKIK